MKITDITRRTLQEDAEADQSKYERAREVIRLITTYAWEHTDPAHNYGFLELELQVGGSGGKYGGTMFCITPEMIDNKAFPQDLMIGVGVAGQSGANGALMVHKGLAKHFPGVNKIIALYYLHKPDPEQARIKLSGNTRLLKTLLHELVHYFDNKDHDLLNKRADFGAKGKKYADREKELGAYYNNSMETNAFFHVVAEKLSALISEFKKDPDNAQDYADIFDFSTDFKVMLRMAMQDFRVNDGSAKGFLTHLSQPKYRRMVGRLFKLHQHAVAALNTANEKKAQQAQMKQAA